MVAKRGYTEVKENGDRYLVLEDGRRYEGTPGQADYRVAHFDRYALRIEQKEATAFFPSQKTFSTRQLIENPTPLNLSELTWRVGLPLSALVLAFLAIPLSAVNPRTGRFFNVLIAIFVYMILQQPHQHLPGVGRQGHDQAGAGDVRRACSHDRRAGPAALPAYVRTAAEVALVSVLRGYLTRQIAAGIVLVLTALLMLFAFFDLIYELKDVGAQGYRLTAALIFVALSLPGHLYELLPVAALIGTLFAMAQLVIHSEYAVMRTSGMSIFALAMSAGADRGAVRSCDLCHRRIPRAGVGGGRAEAAAQAKQQRRGAGVSLRAVGEGRGGVRQRRARAVRRHAAGCAYLQFRRQVSAALDQPGARRQVRARESVDPEGRRADPFRRRPYFRGFLRDSWTGVRC